MYFADEIHSRMTVEYQDIEKSFPLANTITMLAVLSKEDRKKVEEEYEKTFKIKLMDEVYVSSDCVRSSIKQSRDITLRLERYTYTPETTEVK